MAEGVTFVMPAYNVAPFIKEAVASLKSQNESNWRLIIVDDGSTDATLEVAERLAKEDERLKVLSMGSASGSAYQPRKRAILEAETEWVAPLDADDWVDADYLSKLLEIQRLTCADIVYPTMWNPGDAEKEPSVTTPLDTELLNRPFSGRDCIRYTLDGWRINCNGGIIRRELYLKAFGMFDSSVSYSCADELLGRQLLSITPRVTLSDARYFYRPNEDSITRKQSGKLFELLINTQALIPFVKDIYGKDSEEYLLAQRQNFHGYFDAVNLFNKFDFSREDRLYGLNLIKKAKSMIDRKILKGRVSPRYMALLPFGVNATRIALKYLKAKV